MCTRLSSKKDAKMRITACIVKEAVRSYLPPQSHGRFRISPSFSNLSLSFHHAACPSSITQSHSKNGLSITNSRYFCSSSSYLSPSLRRTNHNISFHGIETLNKKLEFNSSMFSVQYRSLSTTKSNHKKQSKLDVDAKPQKPPRKPKLPPNQLPRREPPPMFLSPTSSRNAYVATCAAEELDIPPTFFFSQNRNKIPPLFESGEFHYVSPKSFNYELPTDTNIPEIAFLGRSNVGKSTLLNSLIKVSTPNTSKSKLAHVSKTPGRTQTVNYFALLPKKVNLNHKNYWKQAHANLIDLPGYGYAKAPEKNVQKWQQNTQDFLLHRRDAGTLKRVFLLLDARLANPRKSRGGGGSTFGTNIMDFTVLGWLEEAEIPYSIVLTKCDSVSEAMVVKMANEVCMRYHSLLFDYGGEDDDDSTNQVYQSPIVHVTSGKKKDGINEILWLMDGDFADE